MDGRHERQIAFMEGRGGEEGWGEMDEQNEEEIKDEGNSSGRKGDGSRVGTWESGKGRCAITGRRVLGGTEGLRRVMA